MQDILYTTWYYDFNKSYIFYLEMITMMLLLLLMIWSDLNYITLSMNSWLKSIFDRVYIIQLDALFFIHVIHSCSLICHLQYLCLYPVHRYGSLHNESTIKIILTETVSFKTNCSLSLGQTQHWFTMHSYIQLMISI